jgi:uncharacterized membrane protein
VPNEYNIILIIAHVALSLGFLMLSIYFKNNNPKNINGWYGYRTSMSMKNQATWDEGNRYSSQLMVRIAWINCFISAALFLVVGGVNSFQWCGISLAILSVSVLIFTEIHLKNKFDKEGNPRETTT